MEPRVSETTLRTQQSIQQLIDDVTARIKQEPPEDPCAQNAAHFSDTRRSCGNLDAFLPKLERSDTEVRSAGLNHALPSSINKDNETGAVSTISIIKSVENEECGSDVLLASSTSVAVTLPIETKREEDGNVEVEDHVWYKFEPGLGKREADDESNECCKQLELREQGVCDVNDGGATQAAIFVDVRNIKVEDDTDLIGQAGSKHDSEVFVCFMCDYSATEKDCLTRHVERYHNGTVQKCSKTKLSENTYPSIPNIYNCTDYKLRNCQTKHMNAEHSSNTALYRCTECSYVTKRRMCLTRHRTAKHSRDTAEYQCVTTTKVDRDLHEHIKLAHDEFAELNECPHCNYTTKHKYSLKRHVISKHKSDAPVYPCPNCSYVTKCKDRLSTHIRVLHNTHAELHKCPHCQFATKYKKSLKEHLNGQHDPNAELFKCTDCNYTTKCRRYLTAHVNTTHNSEVPEYQCAQCTYTTKHKRDLSKHIRSLHGISNRRATRVYKCEHCDFATKYKAGVARHLKVVHDPDATLHRCPRCDFVTKHKRSLAQHLIRHEPDAKLYACTSCHFVTKLPTALARHVTVRHNSNAPVYQCARCAYTTKWKRFLLRHISMHTEV